MLINLLMIAAAWGSLLLPVPRWMFFVLSFIVLFLGTLFVLFGAFFTYWSGHMGPDDNQSVYVLLTGILIVLSRARWLIKGIAGDSWKDPSR